MTFFVCGGAGFIGSQFIRTAWEHECFVYDAFTYAGRAENLPSVAAVRGDICDAPFVRCHLKNWQPDAIFNFAAESHVDRSIADADRFIETNVRGTYVLLRESLAYWESQGRPPGFRFIQISTDEVYGDLSPGDPPFREDSPIRPHSPYSASKAAADHLCAAFHHTYGLPVLITRCSNNYGPRQYPEKLIPAATSAFLSGRPFGLHGSGSNIRDWISVEDHARGILAAYERGRTGETYLFGGASERTNLAVLRCIRDYLGCGTIEHIADRLGNDRRYAVDFSKATRELGWLPEDNFEDGLRRTVAWYCENRAWLEACA